MGVKLWSVQDVVCRMEAEGMRPHLLELFRDNCVDGATLLEVTKADLKYELEIQGLGDRKEAWAVVQRLQQMEQRGGGRGGTPMLPPLRGTTPAQQGAAAGGTPERMHPALLSSQDMSPPSMNSTFEATLPSLPGLSSAGSTPQQRDLYSRESPPRVAFDRNQETPKKDKRAKHKAHSTGGDAGTTKVQQITRTSIDAACQTPQHEPQPAPQQRQDVRELCGRKSTGSVGGGAPPALAAGEEEAPTGGGEGGDGQEWDAPDPYGGYVTDSPMSPPRGMRFHLPALGGGAEEDAAEGAADPEPFVPYQFHNPKNRSEAMLRELRNKPLHDPVRTMEAEHREVAIFRSPERKPSLLRPANRIPIRNDHPPRVEGDPTASELARRRSSLMRRLETELSNWGPVDDSTVPRVNPQSSALEVYQTTEDYKVSKSWEEKLMWEAKAWAWLEQDVLGAQEEMKDVTFDSPIGNGGALTLEQIAQQDIKEEASALGDAMRSIHPVTNLTQQRADYRSILNQSHQMNAENDAAYERHQALIRALDAPMIEAGP